MFVVGESLIRETDWQSKAGGNDDDVAAARPPPSHAPIRLELFARRRSDFERPS